MFLFLEGWNASITIKLWLGYNSTQWQKYRSKLHREAHEPLFTAHSTIREIALVQRILTY